jgi:hypothetical protein
LDDVGWKRWFNLAVAEAGWYPDPSGDPGLRLWDGSGWTEYTTKHSTPPPSSDYVRSSDCGLEIMATKARMGWLSFFLFESSASARGTIPEARGDDGASAATLSKWPSVVVVNRAGESRRILGRLQSNEEAVAQADRVRTELDILGIAQWCEKYNIPLKWARRGLA